MSYIFINMLKAKQAASYSNCTKRKIGCIVEVDEVFYGFNTVEQLCPDCSRETCGAVHAEVSAVSQLLRNRKDRQATELFLWAEPPCLQCLNYIKRYSLIRKIYCLSPESYRIEYPLIERRTSEITQRRKYADLIGVKITELDMEEILSYELP